MGLKSVVPGLVTLLLIGVGAKAAPEFQVTGQQTIESEEVEPAHWPEWQWVNTSPDGVLVSRRSHVPSVIGDSRATFTWINISMDKASQTTDVKVLHPKWPDHLRVVYGFKAR